MVLTGPDVSNNNGRIDWALARPHIGFAIAKATQGTGFADAYFDRNRAECGVPFGAYHWLEPAEMYGVPDEIVTQIRWYKRKVGALANGEIIPSLDVETTDPGGGRRVGDPSPNDVEFAVRVTEDEFGVTPMLYGGEPVLLPCAHKRPEILRCPLWKAIYPRNKVAGYGRVDPWKTLTMWQWTSHGSLPGVTSAGLDLNECYVSLQQIMVGVGQPVEEPVVGLCIPQWSVPVDPAGLQFPCYSWSPPFFRAWYGAPLPADSGAVKNPYLMPCVEINMTGALAGHAVAEGPAMAARGTKVVMLRDDGAPFVWLTGMEDPVTSGPDMKAVVRAAVAEVSRLLAVKGPTP